MTALAQALQHFQGAFRILYIEDDPIWMEIVRAWLRSPLWQLTVAASWDALQVLPRNPKVQWSCIVADIDLGDANGNSGIEALQQFTHFPVKVTLSGLKSMEAAFKATRLGGARAVFDKLDPGTQERLPVTLAKFSAMGYMLKNSCPDHVDTLFTLVEQAPRKVSDWYEKACISRRRLEQICDTFLGCSPMDAIQAHRVLTYVQLCGVSILSGNPAVTQAFQVPDADILAVLETSGKPGPLAEAHPKPMASR